MIINFKRVTRIVVVTGLFFGAISMALPHIGMGNLPQATAANPGCALSLSFPITSGSATGPGTTSYRLSAKNVGSGACTSASISVYYADNEKFVSGTPKPTAAGYYWELGDLAPGAGKDIALTTSRSNLIPTQTFANEACLSASNASDACADLMIGLQTPPTTAPAAPSFTKNVPATPPAAPSIVSASNTPAVIPTAVPQNGTGTKEMGIWEWTTPTSMTSDDMATAVNSASANGFNVIYLTIDDYLSLDSLPNGTARTQAISGYSEIISQFLALAAQKGIRVDAEAGWRDWGVPANRWKAADTMNFVASYNKTHTVKFGGMQYDVEPYLLPQYNTDKATVLTQYVGLVDGLATQAKASGVALSMVIPHFFDDVVQWTPEVTANGITAYTDNHLIRLLAQVPQGRLIVMAYRNNALGTNGAIDVANAEVKEADAAGVKVLVAQETGPVTPSYVTFYGLGKHALSAQADAISNTFKNDPSFGGISVDYLDTFDEMGN